MSAKIGFGIMGAGMISKIHAEAISSTMQGATVAVFDNRKEQAEKFSAQFGCKAYQDIDEFLQDPDVSAVSICTPSGSHADLAVKAARAGKHVIIEKPIDISLQKADTIINICKENKVKCSIISQHRFDDAVISLKNIVDSGKLGKLYYGACHTKWYRDEGYYKASDWRGTWKYDGGGALINQSIHYIDLLLYIMGDASEVYGCCETLGHEIEVEDIGIATVKFKNGALGTVQGTTLAYPGLSSGLEIYGENGTVIIKDDDLDYCKIKGMDSSTKCTLEQLNPSTGASAADRISSKSHTRQYCDIIDAIINNREPLITGEDGRKTLEFILAIYQSAKQKKLYGFS